MSLRHWFASFHLRVKSPCRKFAVGVFYFPFCVSLFSIIFTNGLILFFTYFYYILKEMKHTFGHEYNIDGRGQDGETGQIACGVSGLSGKFSGLRRARGGRHGRWRRKSGSGGLLVSFGEFLRKSASRRVLLVRPLVFPAAAARSFLGCLGLPSRSRGLRLVRSKKAVFQRRPVEPADDGVPLVAVRRLDESEALGFLGFRAADHFDRVGY